MNSLGLRIIAVFVLLFASILGVLMPTFVHRMTTGRWPGMRGAVHKQHAAAAAANASSSGGDGGDMHQAAEMTRRSAVDVDDTSSATALLPSDQKRGAAGDKKSRSGSSGQSEGEGPVVEKHPSGSPAPGVGGHHDGASPPWQLNYMHIVKLLSALGCGAIIATGMCHVAPPAIEKLQATVHGDYPYALMIATVLIVLMYTLEHELTLRLQMRAHRLDALKREARDAAARDAHTARCRSGTAHLSHKEDALEVDECSNAKLIRASVATHALEIGVAVHSVIVGVTLGLINHTDQVGTLTIALTFHQFSEGCAIGAAVMESRLGFRHSVILWLIFAVTAPLGVAIGIAVEQSSSDTNSYSWNLAQGILESVACGVLLYMSLVDMMPNLFKLPAADEHDPDASAETSCTKGCRPEAPAAEVPLMHDARSAMTATYGATQARSSAPGSQRFGGGDDDGDGRGQPPPGWYRAAVYTALFTGVAVMCVLAKWA